MISINKVNYHYGVNLEAEVSYQLSFKAPTLSQAKAKIRELDDSAIELVPEDICLKFEFDYDIVHEEDVDETVLDDDDTLYVVSRRINVKYSLDVSASNEEEALQLAEELRESCLEVNKTEDAQCVEISYLPIRKYDIECLEDEWDN